VETGAGQRPTHKTLNPLFNLLLLGHGLALLIDQTGFETPLPPESLLSHAELKCWLLDWIGKAHVDQVTWLVHDDLQSVAITE
jgi:hypothetical protein